MAHRSQCSSTGDNPLDPNYLAPHYREEYRMAIDALVDNDLDGYYGFLQEVNVVDFLSRSEIEYIRCMVQAPHLTAQLERRCMAEDVDGSSDTYWPVHSDHDAPNLDLGWPQQYRFVGPTEVTTLVNPHDPEMPSIKEQVRRMIKTAQQVIAVVMDMFTDVDIFADILGAATRGVAVYVLLDELNAQHFVSMVNNCRVNLDEIKFMRVRTVSGSTYSCRTGKTFKGQMMDRFILVDCRAVLSGNYSFMWSFEKIHRCLAHLFLGQLVTTFDEEFRILYAHSEPLVVENVLANMPHYAGEPEGFYNTEKTHMFNRQYPTMGMEWAERTGEDHMKVGQKMLPFRNESIHSAAEANPSVQRHMNLHADLPYRGDHQSLEHGRQKKGPTEMVGFKRNSYGNIPDYEYLPPQNIPMMRGKQYMEGAVLQGSQFAREPLIYQGAEFQSGYDMYGKLRGQSHHIDQFTGPGYPHEGDEAEPTGAYDHVQRYLQSQSAMEEGPGPRNVLSPVQSDIKRHNMGQSYTCQSSPKQPNLPEQKRFFNVNHKPQDMSQKQGMRDWRISSYLSAFDDAGELDLAELEGSSTCGDVPCFTQEAPCGPVRPEIRPGNREFNRIPSPRENPLFVQIPNSCIVPDNSVNHPTDLSQINIKTTPTSTSESSCTTEGDKVEETKNRESKETNRISEDFLKKKPSRPFQRSSRLRHSLIFNSNLELHMSDEMKDTVGEKEGDEASKDSRVSHILDKRRTGSPFQRFQWSDFAKSNTFDNSQIESAQPEDELNKLGENSGLDKVENSQNLCPLQEKDQLQTAVPERKSQRDECPSNQLQKSSSFIDMNDPDCRLRYFKELAAKRKLAAAKVSQSNPVKATQKFALSEKSSTNDADKNAGPVVKTPETTLKSKNNTVPAPEIKETHKDTIFEESSKDILHRATDAEKIRFKKKMAEESGSTLKKTQKDTDPTLKPVEEVRTVSIAKNQTSPILKHFAQKPSCALSGKSSDPGISSSSEPCSKNSLPTASATLEVKNQAEYVASNTPLTESGLNQFHIPKETDHSHAVQTKCMSPSSTTIAQSSPNISSRDNVSLDFNSKPNLAIVDTSVPSKPDHIHASSPVRESGPSQKPTSTDGDSSQHLPTSETDCFQQLTALGEESSQHPTATESETSQNVPIKTVAGAFQQPIARECESSHHSTANETASSKQPTETGEDSQLPAKNGTDFTQDSNVVESEISKQRHVMGTDPARNEPSQQCIATSSDSSKHSPAMRAKSSQNPSAAEMDFSQQSTTSVVDSSQHHTPKESDFYPKPTATGAEHFKQTTLSTTDPSQHLSTTVTDSSHHLTVTVTDSSQQPTATVTDSSVQPTATVTDSSQQPTATVTDPSVQPTATVTDSSVQPTATVTDSSHHLTATETAPSGQPTATETDSSQQSTATETDSSQQPTATETDSSQQPTATVTDSSQHLTATETAPSGQPTTTETDSSQQSTATETAPSGQPTTTETDSSQQSTATETAPSGQPTTTETDSSQHLTATETAPSGQPTTTETDSSQQSTATETAPSGQPTTTETDSSQQPTATVTDSSQQSTATETDSSQQPTATVTDSSQQPTATETAPSQQSTATETDSSQQPTATVTDSSQHLTATVTDSSQQPTATVTDSSQHLTATETDSSQQPTATETDSSQQPTAIVTDSSQHLTATETDSSQHLTATETDPSGQPTATVTDSSKHLTATETDPSGQPIATVTDSSQHLTATVTDSSQQPTATVTDSSQHLTATETDPSQQPIATVTDSSQHLTATETDSSQHLTATETDSSQYLTETETDSSQHLTATETDSFQQPTATETDSSQHLTATKTNSSQHLTATVTDSSQQPTATITDSSQQPTATETDSAQQPTATITDSSQQPTAIITDSSQQPTAIITDSCQQPTVTETDSSQKTTKTATDSLHQHIAKDNDLSQQLTVTERESSQNSTKITVDTSKHPIETENESLLTATVSCVNEKKKKDDNLSKAFSKPIPDSNSTQADNSISQITVIIDSSSTTELSQTDTVPPCDSQVELNKTQTWTKPCVTPMVKDTDSNALTSLNSSSISSNPKESSCLHDQILVECQKNETITDHSQRHDTSAIAEGPKITQVSTTLDPKQTTTEVENSVINLAEVSENSDLTVQSNSESQSSVAKNPKSIMSAHQLSTANVISCSNLRDDTKVLLEQISAKNQRRSSQSKQTLAAPNESKEGEVSSADKVFSNHPGRPWSSKTTPEERDMLIQKMEKMRKERKVYSRFEAS
ncbi:protein FAM83H isoform X3 [Pimephales promelas]|uniref:protein FAM83H isoform X3 n=1 Tax=Pimephales promelas TaxID=90988 RepID=UPI0019554ACE|nr:protein FAM83H isoform X3 [Pimephales promelas]